MQKYYEFLVYLVSFTIKIAASKGFKVRGVNKIILIGTLGADPDFKYASNGNAIANLSVATSEDFSA